MSTLGDRIKKLRGMHTQKWLAAKLGIPPTTLSNYENNKSELNFATIQALKSIFQFDTDWLLFGNGSMLPKVTHNQEQVVTPVPPADESPRAQGDESQKWIEMLNQAWGRERELMKEAGELKAKIARLEERMVVREQSLRDMRDIYELQEADVGLEETSALNVRLGGSTNR